MARVLLASRRLRGLAGALLVAVALALALGGIPSGSAGSASDAGGTRAGDALPGAPPRAAARRAGRTGAGPPALLPALLEGAEAPLARALLDAGTSRLRLPTSAAAGSGRALDGGAPRVAALVAMTGRAHAPAVALPALLALAGALAIGRRRRPA